MLNALATKGFLPRELPPLFSSDSMKALVGKTLSTGFTSPKANWSEPVCHNLARPGGLRRKLSTPNPVNFYRLSAMFDTHAALLQAHWAITPFSHTTPSLSGARAIANHSSDRVFPRATIRVGARYLVRADIAQFYPSIYTHSVPWALHTKPVAKAEMKNFALPGNGLDRELQACHPSSTLTTRKSLICLDRGSKAQTTGRAGKVRQASELAVGGR
jgi:hypothetical protein